MVVSLRSEDTVPGQPVCRTAPVLNGYLDAFLAILARVPPRLSHQQRILGQGLLLVLHAVHIRILLFYLIFIVVQYRIGRFPIREP